MTATATQPGISSRDGRFEVISRDWIGDGTFLVTVADLLSNVHDIEAYAYAPTPEAARRTARRADPMRQVRWTSMIKLEHVRTRYGVRVGYRFMVSRLDPMYR